MFGTLGSDGMLERRRSFGKGVGDYPVLSPQCQDRSGLSSQSILAPSCPRPAPYLASRGSQARAWSIGSVAVDMRGMMIIGGSMGAKDPRPTPQAPHSSSSLKLFKSSSSLKSSFSTQTLHSSSPLRPLHPLPRVPVSCERANH